MPPRTIKQTPKPKTPPSTPTSTTSSSSSTSQKSRITSSTTSTNLTSSTVTTNEDEEYQQNRLPFLLARQSYHIPPNNCTQDWFQYFKNNHPILGMCCHHPLHPLKLSHRLVMFIASVAFGLATTNAVVLMFILRGEDMDEVALEIVLRSNATDFGDGDDDAASAGAGGGGSVVKVLEITTGMVALWTMGGGVHAVFDLVIWNVVACACCRPGGSLSCFSGGERKSDGGGGGGCCVNIGFYLVVMLTVLVVAMSLLIVVLRASWESEYLWLERRGNSTIGITTSPTAPSFAMEEFGSKDDGRVRMDGESDVYYIDFGRIQSLDSFDFLLGYGVELVLALFVYYPLIGTVLFSGVLGCFRLPILGGRPREVYRMKQREERRQRRRNRKATRDGWDEEYALPR